MTAMRAATREMKGRAKDRETWTIEAVRSYDGMLVSSTRVGVGKGIQHTNCTLAKTKATMWRTVMMALQATRATAGWMLNS